MIERTKEWIGGANLLFQLKAAVLAGFAAGVFDAVYFFVRAFLNDQSPLRPLHNIAAFWMGNAAFSGGAPSAALGLFTHFGLAIIMAGVYAVIALAIPFIRNRPVIFGLLYGAALYFVMYYVVMALRWPSLFPRFSGWGTVQTILVHMIFGMIIAFVIFALDWRRQRISQRNHA